MRDLNDQSNNAQTAPSRSRPRYQWLLFDADGTLFDYDRAEITALSQAFQQLGLAFDSTCLATYRRINKDLWLALEQGLVTPSVLKVRRFELLLQSLGAERSPAEFSELYLHSLATCADLIEGASAVLQALQRHYRLAILTNGLRSVQRGRLARSLIRDCIAELIISEEIGAAKPAQAFFDGAFLRLNRPPKGATLMIGDNWTSDIQGAAAYGLDTCWYNPARQPRPPAPAITHEIGSLHELVPLLCP